MQKNKITTYINDIIKACIHCGMCLPACPTYQVTGNEANSPRGRIYLIHDLIKDPNQQDKQSIKYLDDCLNCLACETVCPSDVQYHSILDYARKDLKKSNYNKGIGGLVRAFAFRFLLPNRKILKLLRNIYTVANKFIPFERINKLSPRFEKPYKEIRTDYIYSHNSYLHEHSCHPEPCAARREDPSERSLRSGFALPQDDKTKTPIVSLPLGCVMDTMYNDVHWDTIKVLNAFGYDVYIPPSNCCGALAYHSHEEKLGIKQFKDTETILAEKCYPVVSNSAGCGAFMKANQNKLQVLDLVEALQQAPVNPLENATSLQNNTCHPEERSDVRIQFRGDLDPYGRTSSSLRMTNQNDPSIKAIYHPACHLNHAQHVAYDYLDFLKQIPGLELEELYEADMCCGSAGFYNLIKAEIADAIGKRKAENIKNTQAKVVITANPGCMSQIQAELGSNYQVVHPVSVLAKHLSSQNQIL